MGCVVTKSNRLFQLGKIVISSELNDDMKCVKEHFDVPESQIVKSKQ